MPPILKNILAVIIGFLIGGLVNSSIVQFGLSYMPIEGLDPNDLESFATIYTTLEPKHFVSPFLAHALGTLVGAIIAAAIATRNNKMKMAFVIGGLFMLGGIAASVLIKGPMWFTIVDLVFAYFPMAWIGGSLGGKIAPNRGIEFSESDILDKRIT